MKTRRKIQTIAELLNPLPEEKPSRSKVVIHHSFNEVLRQLREDKPKVKKTKTKKIQQKKTKRTKPHLSNKL